MLWQRSDSARRQRWGLAASCCLLLGLLVLMVGRQTLWQPSSIKPSPPAPEQRVSTAATTAAASATVLQQQELAEFSAGRAQLQGQQQKRLQQGGSRWQQGKRKQPRSRETLPKGQSQPQAQPKSQRPARMHLDPPGNCSVIEKQLNISVVLVVARNNEDTSWLDLYLSSIPHVVYQAADLNAQHTTAMNKGNEATIYLQYIIDNYDNLPHQVIFSHGASGSWHLLDKVRIIRSLRWGAHGFANLRHANMVCPEVWNCHHLGFDWRWSGNWLHPKDWQNHTRLREPFEALHGNSEDELTDSWLMARNWEEAFLGELGELPTIMTSPCCSEFLVSRERIKLRPKAFYVHLRNWIFLSRESSFNTGKFLEHSWAMIFGERALHMPVPECALIDCQLDGGQVRVYGYGSASVLA